MRVVPVTNAAKIAFFETHLPAWEANPDTIGLTAEQVADLRASTTEARAAFNDAQQARDAAQAATLRQTQAVIKMAALGGGLIKTIRAFAETTDDRSVYAEAQIPLPRRGSPLGPAPTPTNLTFELRTDGAIELRWDAETKGRTAFIIERQTQRPGERLGPWRLIGTATAKTFTDAALPTGLECAVYRVTAERPGGRSEPTHGISVLFGTRPATSTTSRLAA